METFVVRVFVPAGDEDVELTGIVEHSGTGRSQRFRGSDGLASAVVQQLAGERNERRQRCRDEERKKQ